MFIYEPIPQQVLKVGCKTLDWGKEIFPGMLVDPSTSVSYSHHPWTRLEFLNID